MTPPQLISCIEFKSQVANLPVQFTLRIFFFNQFCVEAITIDGINNEITCACSDSTIFDGEKLRTLHDKGTSILTKQVFGIQFLSKQEEITYYSFNTRLSLVDIVNHETSILT